MGAGAGADLGDAAEDMFSLVSDVDKAVPVEAVVVVAGSCFIFTGLDLNFILSFSYGTRADLFRFAVTRMSFLPSVCQHSIWIFFL